ncbi:unnamed protein product [Trifolium pratense]|uniref:Uncharacterized protein n=1 Tax=Trifolium pratense TaxID=57577 RepID=A0ACB0LRX2_TRIPR|nr:unnamed protein product [Trifolium pratense]
MNSVVNEYMAAVDWIRADCTDADKKVAAAKGNGFSEVEFLVQSFYNRSITIGRFKQIHEIHLQTARLHECTEKTNSWNPGPLRSTHQ